MLESLILIWENNKPNCTWNEIFWGFHQMVEQLVGGASCLNHSWNYRAAFWPFSIVLCKKKSFNGNPIMNLQTYFSIKLKTSTCNLLLYWALKSRSWNPVDNFIASRFIVLLPVRMKQRPFSFFFLNQVYLEAFTAFISCFNCLNSWRFVGGYFVIICWIVWMKLEIMWGTEAS